MEVSTTVAPELIARTMDKTLYSQHGQCVTAGDLINLYIGQGMNCYLTGGTPRDWILEKSSNDIDICLDTSMVTFSNVLKDAYSDIDGVMFQLEDFGLLVWGESSQHHIDINILRDFEDYDKAQYQAQASIDKDYLTRDFSFNCFYYHMNSGKMFDPTGVGVEDLQAKRMRLIMAPPLFAKSTQLSYRIAKFVLKGYQMDQSCDAYLNEFMKRDIQQCTDWEYEAFLEHHLFNKGLNVTDFYEILFDLAKRAGCIPALQRRRANTEFHF